MTTPEIEPIKIKEYTVKQLEYPVAGKLLIRSISLGPSGSGKTVLLQNMIVNIYRDCFNRIYVFSPSIDVDSSWEPVNKYIENDMKVQHTDEDPIYFDNYDADSLYEIMETQREMIEYTEKVSETIPDINSSRRFCRRANFPAKFKTIAHTFYKS